MGINKNSKLLDSYKELKNLNYFFGIGKYTKYFRTFKKIFLKNLITNNKSINQPIMEFDVFLIPY